MTDETEQNRREFFALKVRILNVNLH